MREIDIAQLRKSPSVETRRCTLMVYGHTGSGKTEFAATWPRPLYLAENTESGWTTIASMSESKFFEPGVYPKVRAVESAQDMMQQLTRVQEELTKTPGIYRTLVIDSLTFYADMFMAFLEQQAAQNPKEQGLRVFMKYMQHLRHLVQTVHKLPLNVIWLGLAKAPAENEAEGGVALSGQSAQKLPALVDYYMYMRSYEPEPGKPLQFELRTKKAGPWPARCRDGGHLPDVLPNPTYKSFMAALQAASAASQQPAK